MNCISGLGKVVDLQPLWVVVIDGELSTALGSPMCVSIALPRDNAAGLYTPRHAALRTVHVYPIRLLTYERS